MELIHNGRAETIQPTRCATVGDVVAACVATDDRVLLGLRLDGCAIEPAELAEVARLSTQGDGRLEVESRPRRDVACDALESAAEYARRVVEALARTATLLRDGHLERAGALCRDCLDALAVLTAAVRDSGAALGGVAAPLASLEPELATPLAAMEGCFATSDWVGLADCIEYEVAARVALWPDRIGAVRAAAGGTA